MNQIQVHNKTFQLFIPAQEIQKKIDDLGATFSDSYKGKKPLFIAILNGAFMFAADFMKRLDFECEISFVKIASYEGTKSGRQKQLIGLNTALKDRHVVILEDIVDTGRTLHELLPQLYAQRPASLSICTLFEKPEALEVTDLPIEIVGFQIPNKFIVGYGLDYDELGRNYPAIYQLVE